MKRIMKKVTTIALIFMVACTFLFVPATKEVDADYVFMVKYDKKITIAKQYGYFGIDLGSKAKGATKIAVSSSNPKVVKGEALERMGVLLEMGKCGTSKITIRVKTKNGVKKYKSVITVVNYKNPFKSIKVGGVNVTRNFRTVLTKDANINKSKANVSIKLKKGWTIKNIYFYGIYYNDDTGKEKQVSKKITNKKTVFKLHKDDDYWVEYLEISLYNKAKHQYYLTTLYF